jgi:hypothetical protein
MSETAMKALAAFLDMVCMKPPPVALVGRLLPSLVGVLPALIAGPRPLPSKGRILAGTVSRKQSQPETARG